MSPPESAMDRALSAFNSISGKPERAQIVMGVGSGLVAGYIFAKIGRAAALLLGGSLIALQFGVQQDYIHIDWGRVRELRETVSNERPWINSSSGKSRWRKVYKALGENRVFFGSFAGGFLVAVSLS
ncbi:unnamed protein product [Calicophoron daubneyi]|uniref:FUN14 domain-containing protein 1 n=1 Tax=Calicophoron daubneyi TaxID=300641 RepID=A0AAV2TR34_CALDB